MEFPEYCLDYCAKCNDHTNQKYVRTGATEELYQYNIYKCTECGFENTSEIEGLEKKVEE